MSSFPDLSGQFGRYRIVRKLGAGGMGAVYLAEDTALNRQVALKVPAAFASEDLQAAERFRWEALVAARMHHPNLCPVYEIGDYEGRHFFTMPYIEGSSLARLIEAEGRWPVAKALELVRKVAVALSFLHAQGIIHRDLKPSNIIVRPTGDPILMDFGLARDYTAHSTRLTNLGLTVGTPAYTAPEQLTASPNIGPPADVYGLGSLLYELLTGTVPFQGAVINVVAQVLAVPPRPPSELRPDLPPQLDDLCLRTLAKKPEERFPDMNSFTAALDRLLLVTSCESMLSSQAPPPPVPAAAPPALQQPTRSFLAPTSPGLPVQSEPAPAAPPGGQLFERPFGKYELLRELGRGEAGVVYLARHREHGWPAALKVMPGARFSSPACVQRLLREARVGLQLRHPNLCQLLDAGTQENEFYLAMEYLEGQTLRSRSQQNRQPILIARACYHAYQLFDALSYLADHEVVHRDVKPGNVMIGAGDRLKLMDLGLAKVPDPQNERLTLSGVILGTPAYMAPEQITDASRATAQSDLYAAGATFFELLTGTTPFQADSPVVQMRLALAEAPTDPRTLRPDLPEPLAVLLLRLLHKQPEHRPEHDEILATLRSVCPGLPAPAAADTDRRTGSHSVATTARNVSIIARINRAAERMNDPEADDLAVLLPVEDGQVQLGSYVLEERIGPRAAVNTYRARHGIAGDPYIVRLLPLALSQLAPERLRVLLAQRAQLMRLSKRSRQLSRLLDIGKVRLRRGTFDTLYYTVEDFLPGRPLETRIAAAPLKEAEVARCLHDAARGLWALHRHGIVHGNLHPGKLFFDEDNQALSIADLSHARPAQTQPNSPGGPTGRSVINDLDWLGESLAQRRQYLAPEILCDGAAPGPLSEQYSLGVLFVEVLGRRCLRTHHNDLQLLKCVQQDLQDCLFAILDATPRLGRMLRRMTAINPEARYPDLGQLLQELANRPQRQPKPVPPEPASDYEVFISYRRRSGAETARAILARLQQESVRAFLDVDSLAAGRFDERLLHTIAATRHFVLILSRGSLDRCQEEGDWLRREVTHAFQTGRNIIPILMPGFHMPEPEDLPDEMATLPRCNGIQYSHAAFDHVIATLLRFLRT